ncbi:hypothetical protein MKW92_011662 [Papaver armeniacum]|nr:hypothetical protein MKW92_011662 [Papaver armeniacum]
MMQSIAGGLINLGNNIASTTGAQIMRNSATTLTSQLKEDKEIIKKATKDVMDGYTKLIDRLDSNQFGSLTILTIFFALNVFFYSRPPPPGKNMKIADLLGLVFYTLGICLSFLWIQFQKIGNFEHQLNALKNLPKTEGQDVKINLTESAKLVTKYANLEPSQRISAFEAEIFQLHPIEMLPPTSRTHLWFMGFLVVRTNVFMIGVVIY